MCFFEKPSAFSCHPESKWINLLVLFYWQIKTTCFTGRGDLAETTNARMATDERSPSGVDTRPACSTSPLTDSTFQGNPTALQAHRSSPTRLTFPGPLAWLSTPHPAEKAKACFAALANPLLASLDQARRMRLSGDSDSIRGALNSKARVWPQTLGAMERMNVTFY